MRQFTTGIQDEIDKRLGTEPLLMIEVDWAEGGTVAYADQKINGEEYPYPFVVSIGNFNTSTAVDGSSDSQNLSIVLNDIDGSLKNILNTQDIHKRPVRLYLLFAGLPINQKVLLVSGVINSPIVWDEGARTLSFEVLSKLEATEVGFSMDDSPAFPFIPPADRNKNWPLVFGDVCNMQAVPVTAVRKGYLGEGVGAIDPTLDERLCQAQKLRCSAKETTKANESTTLPKPGASVQPFGGSGDPPQIINQNEKKYTVDRQCVVRRFNEICAILFDQAQQIQYVKDEFIVRGGASFPQNIEIDIKINDVRFTGVMVDELFTVSEVHHPDNEIENPPCMDIKDAKKGFRLAPGGSARFWQISSNGNTATYIGPALNSPLSCTDGKGLEAREQIVDGAGASWDYYQQFEKGRFIWLPAGSNVFLASESEVLNIVSLIPGTVNQVAAYRTFGDTSLLTEVATDRYTVHTVDYQGYEVVEIRLPKALSLIDDEKWEDTLYVSFTSDVGPNPADVIQWLVEKYTSLTIDAASFASVHADLANYPCNFYTVDRTSVLDLINQIAYQFRCAVGVRNNVVYLTYLSKEPTSVATITESDIISNSFQVTTTDTEDLVTRHHVTWKGGDARVTKEDDPNFSFMLKQNIPKYGMIEETKNYFTQNIFEPILKSATFWMIREANTWKYVEFETPIKRLNLEVFDAITLNIAQFPTTKCIITQADYDSNNNTIKFKAWTPIRLGENDPYYWAWPAAKPFNAMFPLQGEVQSGNGYDFEVIPPADHPLAGGYDPELAQYWTDGDRFPSDVGDEFPIVQCEIATGAEIADDLEPEIEAFEPLADKMFNDRQDEIAGGTTTGGGGSNEQEDKDGACGEPTTGQIGCLYEVRMNYVTPTLVGNAPGPSPPQKCAGPCIGTGEGLVCAGPIVQMCHTFGSLFAATAFQTTAAAGINRCPNGGVRGTVGVSSLYGPGPINAIPCDDCVDGGCDTVPGGDPNHPMADSGETTNPGVAT